MPERLMTSKILQDLRARKFELEKQVQEMGREGSGHQRASLHDDAVYRKDIGTITSTDSPLGRAILGRSMGETAEVRINQKNSFKVKILEVLPGEFD